MLKQTWESFDYQKRRKDFCRLWPIQNSRGCFGTFVLSCTHAHGGEIFLWFIYNGTIKYSSNISCERTKCPFSHCFDLKTGCSFKSNQYFSNAYDCIVEKHSINIYVFHKQQIDFVILVVFLIWKTYTYYC